MAASAQRQQLASQSRAIASSFTLVCAAIGDDAQVSHCRRLHGQVRNPRQRAGRRRWRWYGPCSDSASWRVLPWRPACGRSCAPAALLWLGAMVSAQRMPVRQSRSAADDRSRERGAWAP